MKKKMKLGAKKWWIALVMFFIGFCIFIYPWVSFRLTQKNQSSVIENYISTIDTFSSDELEEQQEIVDLYNDELLESEPVDPGVSYVNYIQPGTMVGYIKIPKINVSLPIYQGVDDVVLREGVGHIEKTSLPTNNDTAHIVLTGHRGLPTAELFTNLDKVEKEDEFVIMSLGKQYTYKVDKISVVTPKECAQIGMTMNHNYATLITCTPYMVNTHRLMVRGELVSEQDIVPEKVEEKVEDEIVDNTIEEITNTTENVEEKQNEKDSYEIAYQKLQGKAKQGKSFEKYQLLIETNNKKGVAIIYSVIAIVLIGIVILVITGKKLYKRLKDGEHDD